MTRIKKTLLLVVPVCLLAVAATFTQLLPHKTSSLVIRDAFAADSCTNWMAQPNGCSFRTCVDDRGRQYCEQACGRSAPTRVSCR